MWIVTIDGFFSVVQHKDFKDLLLVRTRARKDMRNLIRSLHHCGAANLQQAHIEETETADYPFRIQLRHDWWAEYLAWSAREVNYTNFKDAVAKVDKKRSQTLLGVWSALFAIEDEEAGGTRKARLKWSPPKPEIDCCFLGWATGGDVHEDDCDSVFTHSQDMI